MADDNSAASTQRHTPKSTTVFVAAFVAGAVAAVVVNRALDLHLAQSKPQVESEPIFVALRPLPQGAPVTVWDVALRDTPRAMVPGSALRAKDSFEGSILKYPLREGQPLLSLQLMAASPPIAAPAATEAPAAQVDEAFVMPAPAPAASAVARLKADENPSAREANDSRETKPEELRAADPVAVESTENADRMASSTTESPSATNDHAGTPVAPDIAATAKGSTEPSPSSRPEGTSADLQPTAVAVTALPETQEPTMAQEAHEGEPTRVASDVEPLLDIPSRPAADLETIPSVMAHSEAPAEATETSAAASGAVRYLVVPERIAQQADTSFVSPPAVEPVGEASPVPSPTLSSPPPSAAAQQARVTTTQQPKAKQPQKTAGQPTPKQRAPRSANGGSRSTPTQRQAKPQPQSQQRQATNNRQPSATSVQSRQANQPRPSQSADRSRTEKAESKPKGAMFPNLAAGLEAMSNRWRSEADEAVATDIPSGQRRK